MDKDLWGGVDDVATEADEQDSISLLLRTQAGVRRGLDVGRADDIWGLMRPP